jgi:hypothetical protein
MDGTIPGDRTNCPVETTLRLIGGKWRMFVLFRLGEGPMRFNALQRSLAPITQRVLTRRCAGSRRTASSGARCARRCRPTWSTG